MQAAQLYWHGRWPGHGGTRSSVGAIHYMQQPLDDVVIRHLARVVEWSDDAIVSKDLNGIVTSWNRAAERMFGYTAEEAIGRSIRMIVPADRQGEEDMV